MPLFSSTRIGTIVSILSAAFVAACAVGPAISTNKDPAADFGAYRTFGFIQPLGTDRGTSRTRLSGMLIASSTRQLQSVGLKSVGRNPDLLVNFYSGIQTTSSTRSFAPAVRNYGGWAGYPLDTLTSASISEGTLIIDIVDRRTNRLVWQGRAEQRVTEAMADDLQGTVDALVTQLFSKFP